MKKIFFIFFILIVSSLEIKARSVDSSLGQMLRGFTGSFSTDIMRAGAAYDYPSFLLNPALYDHDKSASSVELYSQNRYSRIDNSVKYNALNFLLREKTFWKFANVQAGFHYSNFKVDNILEYGKNAEFIGKSNDVEELFALNFNNRIFIKKEAVQVGLNLKNYTHRLSTFKTNSFSIDGGLLYSYKNFTSGLSARNIISTKLKYVNSTGVIPRQITMGGSYRMPVTSISYAAVSADYSFKTANTGNYIAYGVLFGFKSRIKNKPVKIELIYGSDNTYINHSFGVNASTAGSFHCGFGYQVNNSLELGDNTLLYAGWHFGAQERARNEKYVYYESAGDSYYSQNDFSNALRLWKIAADLYPAKQTRAGISYEVLNRQLDSRNKYSEILFNANTEYFVKGRQFYENNNYLEAVEYFANIKFNDDIKNRKIFDDANEYIKKISLLLFSKKSDTIPLQQVITIINDTASIEYKQEYETFKKEIGAFIKYFIELNRPELAEIYTNRYSAAFADTELKYYKKMIEDNRNKNAEIAKAKSSFDADAEIVKQKFIEGEYREIIDRYEKIKSDYFGDTSVDLSELELYYQIAKLRLKESPVETPRDSTDIDRKIAESYYIDAAKKYLNYLKSGSRQDLGESVKLYEKILQLNPKHRCIADYQKAKQIFDSLK